MTYIGQKCDINYIMHKNYYNWNYVTNNMLLHQFKSRVMKTNHYITDETNRYFKDKA